MNRFFLLLLVFLVCEQPLKSRTDVLMTVNGVDVPLSEFLFCYDMSRNQEYCSPTEFFTYFMRGKLMVMDARLRRLDESDGFLRKLEAAESSLSSDNGCPDYASGAVKMGMFTYRLPQMSSESKIRRTERFMKGIYEELLSDIKPSDILSEIKDSCLIFEDYGGRWIDRAFLLDEINSAIDKLAAGALSEPVYSPEGIHIVLLKQKSDKASVVVEGNEEENDFRLKQLEESLLISEWKSKTPLDYRVYSEDALKRFFKAHKSKYRWDMPHYKGAVIHCRNKKVASRLSKRLRKKPVENWPELIDEYCSETGEDVMFDVGLFKIGKNEYVDKLAFKCGDFDNLEDYPYTTVVGRCLDYEPDDYRDVYDDVVKDYIKEGEKRFFDDLEKKLGVEKHLDVLKTVNCSGSN